MKGYQIALLFFLLPILQYFLGTPLSIKPWIRFEPYWIFWLIVPFSWAVEYSILISFAFGLVLDIFFPPYGGHTFSGLWVWALRGIVARISRPLSSPDEAPHPETFSLGEWTLYAFPLGTAYFLSYYLLQELSWASLLWALLSASYSFLGVFVLFAIFVRKSDAR
jgi:hypothetical protein